MLKKDKTTTWIEIDIEGDISKAINYNDMTGKIEIGDKVVLNTTAVSLSLGTGGYHFVIYNYSNTFQSIHGKGHIMKLRYTPLQLKCLAVEEEDSPYHDAFNKFTSLDGNIFIVGTLHSMLAPISSMLKWIDPSLKINYIMTDAGALPIQFSNTVKKLKEKGIINKTITIGNAFGGDIEAINIYSGIIASKEAIESDITIITMGPGIVGTGTKYGFSGIEQGYIVDAVNNLGGIPFIVPRISFKDKRDRHRGISHHTLTVLDEICNTGGKLVIPKLDEVKNNLINKQLSDNKILERYEINYENGEGIVEALNHFDLDIKTMGRGIEEDREFFMTLGAVGRAVYKYFLKKEET
ncbi:DUF3866 family protein [Anaerosalibacter massiliensis]|uniref:DUF3866 family protein n=1 Tax=Anaerosalibacter massiliensis TaxID=1347392 RepID=A0A9X2MEQ7_9FIRM|nr:DUF3866 family protein [Anaerosalibacter massiliensis]